MVCFMSILFLSFITVSRCKIRSFGGIIPVAYSPDLGIPSTAFNSAYLKGVQIYPDHFRWPFNSAADLYHAAIGEFDPFFALNTTFMNVPYFLTEKLPPHNMNSSNWLRIAPELQDLVFIARKISQHNFLQRESIIIADKSSQCGNFLNACMDSFKWDILTNGTSVDLYNNLMKLKSKIGSKPAFIAICEGNASSNFSEMAIFKLLETGLYVGSSVFVYSTKNMTASENLEKYAIFKDAGADLTIITPALSSTTETPIDITIKTLEYLSQNAVANNDSLLIDGEFVRFSSENFLRLIHKTSVSIKLSNREQFRVCFTKQGFLCVVEASFTEIQEDGVLETLSGFYDKRSDQLSISFTAPKRPTVTLLAYQDVTFLPSIANQKYSVAMKLIREMFSTDWKFNYKLEYMNLSSEVPIQTSVIQYLLRPGVKMTISAFPMPFNTNMSVQHTEAVLYDGIVMLKSRTESKILLLRIFDSLSLPIWICVFAFLLVVAAIFFVINVLTDRQTRQMGLIQDDEDASLFTRFLTVIFQNFSAIFLAKMIVKPKRASLRVLYQTYWMASILFVATYAASLAEQRFVPRDSSVPFDTLEGLLKNNFGYQWMFLRNSSVVWTIQNTRDSLLISLWNKAKSNWPGDMLAESVDEASRRIAENDNVILIVSRLEAKQIVSEQCQLRKVGLVEYLYGLGYFLSGEKDFAEQINGRINTLNEDHFFLLTENGAIGIGDCPTSTEQLNMQTNPFSTKELGGLFIVVLIGLIIAFAIAAIEFVVEKYPMYRQRQRANLSFGEKYSSEVLDVQDGGIYIRVLENNSTAFVDSSRIKSTKGPDGRIQLTVGSYVQATYLGNDPTTTNPIYSVAEEKLKKNAKTVPPNNQFSVE